MMMAAAINAPLCFRWKKKTNKKNRHPMPNGQNDPQSLCVVFVIFLLYTKVNRVKMCKASNARGQNDPQSLCVVFVICLFYTKVNGMKMCMFSFNRVKLQSFRVITSSLAWLFWERSAFLSASYSSSWSWNRDIQVLMLGKKNWILQSVHFFSVVAKKL